MASIAAALQPQRVPLSMLVDGINSGEEHSEALNNKWAASLAGVNAFVLSIVVYEKALNYRGPGRGCCLSGTKGAELRAFEAWTGWKME